jgi:hypothetical protein
MRAQEIEYHCGALNRLTRLILNFNPDLCYGSRDQKRTGHDE